MLQCAQMLDNERYNLSIYSLKDLIKKGRLLSTAEANRERLFDEQYKTQAALKSLDVNSDTLPEKIPMINKVIMGPKITSLTNYFSLIGMPNSGKTSAILDLGVNQSNLYWVFGDAARRSFGMLKQRQVGTDFAQLTLAQGLRSRADISYAADTVYVASLLDQNSPETTVVFERDDTDLAFVRANFLFGRIDADILKRVEENFLENLNRYKGLSRTIVSCFVHPITSLERERERKEHLVVQQPFLAVLYEQNLRFHWEVLNFEKIYGQKLPFNYLAINMSDEDSQKNREHLEEQIRHIATMNKEWQQEKLL